MAISGPWVIRHNNVAEELTRATKLYWSIYLNVGGRTGACHMQSKYKFVDVVLT